MPKQITQQLVISSFIRGRYTNSSIYHADLVLMECDTCTSFWKYTTKPEDSMGLETLYSPNEVDTIVRNMDTSYQRMEVLSDKGGNIEVRRIAELYFRVSKNHDLLVNDKLYKR